MPTQSTTQYKELKIYTIFFQDFIMLKNTMIDRVERSKYYWYVKLNCVRWMNYMVTDDREIWPNYPIIFQSLFLIFDIAFKGFYAIQYWKYLFGKNTTSRVICKYILCNFCYAEFYVICKLFLFLVLTSRSICCWWNENIVH